MPSPGDLPDPGMEPASSTLTGGFLPAEALLRKDHSVPLNHSGFYGGGTDKRPGVGNRMAQQASIFRLRTCEPPERYSSPSVSPWAVPFYASEVPEPLP